ncbi:MAG: glycosyltransferase [Muribaculaceae bacterium]|nr:glycosyltransferase [Muribaculaceae bacterium]
MNQSASVVTRPDVSFVMPAYNATRFIARALDSLLVQKGAKFEIVVVDDCSTDTTAAIVNDYAARYPDKIRLISMPTNSGCAFIPRKRAIEEARAPLVAPLDADDWVNPDYLETLLKYKHDTGADIVYPVMYLHNGSEAKRFVPAIDFPTGKVWTGRDMVALTLDGWQIGAGGGIILRELYLKCFRKFEMVPSVFADEVLTRQLLLLAPKITIADTPYFYMMQPDSVTHSPSLKLFDFLQSDRALVSFANDHWQADEEVPFKAARQLFHNFFRGIRLLDTLRNLTQEQRYEVRHLLNQQRQHINWRLLRGRVSPRYYILARLGVKTSLFILPLYDRFKSQKKF